MCTACVLTSTRENVSFSVTTKIFRSLKMTLKSFPRGGKKPDVKPNIGLAFNRKDGEKRQKKNFGRKSQDVEPLEEEKHYLANSAECLTFTNLTEGMVVLGRIQATTEYDMIVSLPGRLSGQVQATDISDTYTSLLRSVVNSEDGNLDEFRPLSELYKCGEYIVCCVKTVNTEGKFRLSLSLEAALLNRNLDPTTLAKGSKIVGTISSIEDHGYVVDTGIDNLRSFLGNNDMDQGVQYYPGQQIFCTVKKVKTAENSTTVQLTSKTKHASLPISEDGQSLDGLVPGSRIVLSVGKILSNGLQVTFNEDKIGYVNRIYLEKPLESYKCDQEIVGRLMYVMPTVKFAYFTLLPSSEEQDILQIGEIFENARVSFIGNRGVVVSLKKGFRGIIPFRRTEVAFEKIATIFTADSTHKCRILAYDCFERLYVCTMERKLLEEKHFSTANLATGDILEVEIAKISTGNEFTMVTAGRTKGWVAPEQLRDPDQPSKALKLGDVVKARVLGQDKKQKGILLTLKKSLVESKLPILKDIKEAKKGEKYLATVIKITENGILVRFYEQVKGWISAKTLDKNSASRKWDFVTGQTIVTKIEDIKRNEGKLTLSVYSEPKEQEEEEKKEILDFSVGESIDGTVIESSVQGIYVRIQKNEKSVTAFLPAGHMSPCLEVGSYLAARYTPGTPISALIFSTKPVFLLTRTFVSQEQFRNFNELKIGDCLPCSIHEIDEEGLKVVLPIANYDSYGIVHELNVENIDALSNNQILFARVTSINKKKDKKIVLTTSLHGIFGDLETQEYDLLSSIDVLSLHFNKLQELADNSSFFRSKTIARAKIGEKVDGVVEKVTEHGLIVKLEKDLMATVRIDHYRGNVKVGDKVRGAIIWINYIHEIAEITLLPNFVNAISTKQTSLPKVSIDAKLRGDIVLVTNWFVLVVLKGAGKGIIAALPIRRHLNDIAPSLENFAIGVRIRCHVVLDKPEVDLLPICLLKSSFDSDLPQETSPIAKREKLKRKNSDGDSPENSPKKHKPEVLTEKKEAPKMKKRAEKKSQTVENTEEKIDTKKEKVLKKKKKKISEIHPEVEEDDEIPKKKKSKTEAPPKSDKIKSKTAPAENACKAKVPQKSEKTKSKTVPPKQDKQKSQAQSANFLKSKHKESSTVKEISKDETEEIYSESEVEEDPAIGLKIEECGFFWDNKPDEDLTNQKESSSEEEEEENDEENQKKKKKKKLSAAERREMEQKKEREIREKEEALASNESPNSVDQFDRLVLSSPDNSMIWIQYMAYHLQATEIEKARAVARRAIKTINFRSENERLNVWQAWLNLESRFGTAESLEKVFQEASRTNDGRAIYLHMLTVHSDAGRQPEIEKVVTSLIGKFKQSPQVWVECGAAFLKIGLKEKSRHIMQRALQSLPASEHVNLMVKFAQMENKFGDKERAETLFEQILSSYPKRVDVWSSYVDSLVKSENLDAARKVLEKAVVQVLPARKMKTLFKKYVDFEEKHGTPEGVAYVKDLALKYVENECSREGV